MTHLATTHNNELRSFTAWREIGASETLLDWVKNGVPIPFNSQPSPFEIKNRLFTLKETCFINDEIKRLLNLGYISVSLTKPRCVSNINVVPKKNNKFRLITDLRKLNYHCTPPKFVYESIEQVLEIVDANDYLVTVDLKDAFFHVKLNEEFRTYFGFKWLDKYYVWNVTPFGWNVSPYYCCKLLRCVIGHLRSNNIKVTCYVDDILLSDSESSISQNRDNVLDTLSRLDLTINYEKSDLSPSCSKDYLGYNITTNLKTDSILVKIPNSRITKVKRAIKNTLVKGVVYARQLAKIAGQLVSMVKAILPTKLFLRNIYRLLSTRQTWQDILVLDIDSIHDLEWWYSSISSWNGRIFRKQTLPSIQISTDASQLAWGGTILGGTQRAQGFWDNTWSTKSSNQRELEAILLTLESFLPYIKGKDVQILTDNIVSVSYINLQGGPSKPLTEIAAQIWNLSIRYNFEIQARHLPGHMNVESDQLSRLKDQHEWSLHRKLYNYIDKLWGTHTIDRFASQNTTQCLLYNSRFHDPFTTGIDALKQMDWALHNNFVNPPFRFLNKVLQVVKNQRAWATVIAPKWRNQLWCQRLRLLSVCPPIRLPHPRLICVPKTKQLPEPLKNSKWTLWAWRIYGGKS